MILAAANCAEDDEAEAPRELEMFLECRQHGVLYAAGGLADQPAALWRQMNAAYDVWDTMRDWRKARDRIKWSRDHPRKWKIVQLVIRLREST